METGGGRTKAARRRRRLLESAERTTCWAGLATMLVECGIDAPGAFRRCLGPWPIFGSPSYRGHGRHQKCIMIIPRAVAIDISLFFFFLLLFLCRVWPYVCRFSLLLFLVFCAAAHAQLKPAWMPSCSSRITTSGLMMACRNDSSCNSSRCRSDGPGQLRYCRYGGVRQYCK